MSATAERWKPFTSRQQVVTHKPGFLWSARVRMFPGLPVHAGSQGAAVGKDGVMRMPPWDCTLSDYWPQDGMLIPMDDEAAWVLPEGRKVYFVGRIKTLHYGFWP